MKIKEKNRGEVWEMIDGREATFLTLLGINNLGIRTYSIINESGKVEVTYESHFVRRLSPPEENK